MAQTRHKGDGFPMPCGTRPINRSPREQRPRSRTMAVLVEVSSINTSRAGSNMPCSRIQRRRARATSTRSCSAARRLFFLKLILCRLKNPPDCTAAAGDPSLAVSLRPLHPASNPIVWKSEPTASPRVLPTAALPPVGLAATLPVSCQSCSHFTAELALTSKQSAASRRDAPAITASSRRIRKSREQGFGIEGRPFDQTPERLPTSRAKLRIQI